MNLNRNILLKGIGASQGIVTGRALVFEQNDSINEHYCLLDDKQIEKEIRRFKKAVNLSREQLQKAKTEVSKRKIQEAQYIIDTHILILQDRVLIEGAVQRIRNEKIDSALALKKTMDDLRKKMEAVEDEYMKERGSDVDYIEKRILENLSGNRLEISDNIREKVILVANDLSPADTVNMNVNNVLGFITACGGKTSHTAIISRALKIPSVVGLKDVIERIKSGDTVILDGVHGVVIVNPDPEAVLKYSRKQEEYEEFQRSLFALRDLPSESTDGFSIRLTANIEIVEEVDSVIDYGAEGIGLFRTEFLYLNRKELPGEDELFEIFKGVVERVAPKHVTIRTIDIGGDKFMSHIDVADEMNPVMGLRAIRFCLKDIPVFKTQLRAILRASAFGTVKILLPMISGIQEVLQTKHILSEVKKELRREKKSFDKHIETGIMIEVPSSAIIADMLAKEVDFFSIGTNDLIQYLIAIDRVNEQVSYLYEPLHPAVLKLLKQVIDSAHDNGIYVAMCGEMAGEPAYLPILLGLGIDELSMNPVALLKIKRVLRTLDQNYCHDIVEKLFQFNMPDAIMEFLEQAFKGIMPLDFNNKK